MGGSGSQGRGRVFYLTDGDSNTTLVFVPNMADGKLAID